MPRNDQDQCETEINMCRDPAFHRAKTGSIAAPADAEQREQDNEHRPRRTQHVTLPGAAAG